MKPSKNDTRDKTSASHLDRAAYVYVRQSSPEQVKRHVGSTRRQYDLADKAVEMGWPRERVKVIDEDQGQSGSTPQARQAFADLVAAVARGEVGIVIGLEVSRLARNSPDWCHLVYMCRWTDTLIADEHGVYDPSLSTDRMVLAVRGQVSELEHENAIHRMVEARWTKAQEGNLITTPPAGYDIDDLGQIVMSSDELVVAAVRTVFTKFDELGSARQVFIWWQDQGRRFPVREMELRSHPVEWREPKYAMFIRTLHHPIYSGAYVHGRSETVRDLDPEHPGQLRIRRRQRAECRVLIQDHHDAYIPFEKFLQIQERLAGNAMKSSDSEGNETSPAREGFALLQGLVRCGKCGRRMNVSYGGTGPGRGRRTMQYRCWRKQRAVRGTDCQLIGGKRIDNLVVEHFLTVTQPAAVEAAQQAGELTRRDHEEADRYWSLEIEKAEFEAKRAERQFHAVEPENRLVGRVLERRWNHRLSELESVRVKAQTARTESETLSDAEIERAARLGSDLEAVWTAETTTNRDRKRLLRCAIEEVQLTTEEKRYIVRIVWKGGATTDGYVARRRAGTAHATSEETIDLVRKLAEEFDDAQIARILNKQGRRSGLGNPFTKSSVLSLRGHNRIPVCRKPIVRDPREGPFTADEATVELGVCMTTIHRWLRDGVLAGTQATPGAPWRIVLSEEVRQRLVGGEAPRGWVGLGEASRQLGLPKQRVAYLVKTGKLRAMRTTVGKRCCWRIDLSSADSGACGSKPGLFDQTNNADTSGS